jgi:hypothetical protein
MHPSPMIALNVIPGQPARAEPGILRIRVRCYRHRSGMTDEPQADGTSCGFAIKISFSIGNSNRGISAASQKSNCCYAPKWVVSGIWYT